MLSGKYVRTFAEATHALPEGMHMDASYPFKLPAIEKIEGAMMTIREGAATETVRIVRGRNRESAYIRQSSSFETLFDRKPKRFRLLPFRDERIAREQGK